jgi:hypothetical protein
MGQLRKYKKGDKPWPNRFIFLGTKDLDPKDLLTTWRVIVLPRATMGKCRPRISAICSAEYPKIQRAKSIILLVSLNGCGESYRPMGKRIQREVEEYKTLSEQVMEMTKSISGSVEKFRASVDQ